MKTIANEELRDIQMGILLNVHQFCVENDIKYSLADGSLIGAIRHKGFIPWDDDIDICMERKDYKRFVELFPQVYNKKISLISLERDSKWAYPFAKAYDNRTILKESATNNKPEIGVDIDIFPLDEVPSDNRWEHYNSRRRAMFLFFRTKSLKWRSKRSLYKNFIMIFAKILLCPFSHRQLSVIMDRYAQKYNNTGCDNLFECCLGLIIKKPFIKSAFESTIDMSFEGHRVKVMKGYNECLEKYYGNYMQLPPVEKRVSHHVFEAYWK